MAEKEYIKRETARTQLIINDELHAADLIKSIPAADVRPVVLCGVCELHGHCYTEDVFTFARLAEENRFCAVGKVKTNGEERTNFCPNCGADMRLDDETT